MRDNQPVTQVNRPVGENQFIISSTSERGVIRSVNRDFLAISGFEREEVIGQPHNVIRHPDMPPAVFKMMWDHLKAGEHWMGIVKNRCKNGDHYWVCAHVTPVRDQGQIIGYESVRSKPTDGQISRADATYQRIRAGRSPIPWWEKARSSFRQAMPLMAILGIPSAIMAWWDTGSLSHALSLIALFLPLSMIGAKLIDRRFVSVNLCEALITADPITQYIFSRDLGNQARNRVQQYLDKAAMRTITRRVEDGAQPVVEKSRQLVENGNASAAAMDQLREETDQIAVAMEEMTSTIEEVTRSVVAVSHSADQSRDESDKGNQVLDTVVTLVQHQFQRISEDAEKTRSLETSVAEIGSIAQSIRGIAEQTNLLALNAAIEAARAGEAGRGFAVVADEVRTLASNTQSSTDRIEQLLRSIEGQVLDLVQRIVAGREEADRTKEQMLNVQEVLRGVLTSIGVIADSALQMASAAEEQAQVARDVSSRVTHIRDQAESSSASVSVSAELSREVDKLAKDQLELVSRFTR